MRGHTSPSADGDIRDEFQIYIGFGMMLPSEYMLVRSTFLNALRMLRNLRMTWLTCVLHAVSWSDLNVYMHESAMAKVECVRLLLNCLEAGRFD